MALYIPVDIEGEGFNISFHLPFVPPVPTVNKGSWVGIESILKELHPSATITVDVEPTWLCPEGGLINRAFTIAPEYLDDFKSSQASCLLLGDIAGNPSVWISATATPGLYQVQSGPLKAKDGVANPKVRLIIHNTTASFLASELIDLVPPTTIAPSSLTDSPYTEDTPLFLRSGTEKVQFKVRSNVYFFSVYEISSIGGIGNNPYPVVLKSIDVQANYFLYTFEMTPIATDPYGKISNLAFSWRNMSGGYTLLPFMVLTSGGTDIYFTLPSGTKTLDYILYNGKSYTPRSAVVGANVPVACTTQSRPELDAYVVKVFSLAASMQHPTVFHLPLSTGGGSWLRIFETARSVAKDQVVVEYTLHDVEGALISSHSLTWLDLYNTTSPTDQTTYLELALDAIPASLRMRYDLNGEGDTMLNFIFQIEDVSYTVTPDLINGNVFNLRPLILTGESVDLTLTGKHDDYVNQRMIFDPSNTVTVNLSQESYPTGRITHRNPTVEETLNAIH